MLKIEGRIECKLPHGVFAPTNGELRDSFYNYFFERTKDTPINYFSLDRVKVAPFGSKGYMEMYRRVKVVIDFTGVFEFDCLANFEVNLFRVAKELLQANDVQLTVMNIAFGYKYNPNTQSIELLQDGTKEKRFIKRELTHKDMLEVASAYDKLKFLVGLNEIKLVVKRILATYSINQLRKNRGLTVDSNTMHMVFTGNPGSAKTTVARLLVDIFYSAGIIKRRSFIECARYDLVGQYIGSTAPKVKEIFRKAYGGILFIDEAYSLTGDKKDFGPEAITTIVQEMENSRDNIIVIFAGYPEKMKKFLAQNEGMRSRIAFHLDFPDYTAEELMQILELMLANREYTISNDAKAECGKIFEEIVKEKDFGNGRFVRNLLEKAIMKQSLRLYENSAMDIDIEAIDLLRLEVNDFKQ